MTIEKTGEWKLFYETRNAESGLTIQVNKLENNEGLVLFSFRMGRQVDNGKGGQFIPIRVKGKPGKRDIHSWANEMSNLVMEAEEQVLLYFEKRDAENGRTSQESEISENNGSR